MISPDQAPTLSVEERTAVHHRQMMLRALLVCFRYFDAPEDEFEFDEDEIHLYLQDVISDVTGAAHPDHVEPHDLFVDIRASSGAESH